MPPLFYRLSFTFTLAACVAVSGNIRADGRLVVEDFASPDAMKQVKTTDTTVQRVDGPDGPRLEVVSGTESLYPNVRLDAPGGKQATWDLSAYTHIEIDVTNLSDTGVRLSSRIDSPSKGQGRESISGKVSLAPGESGTIIAEIDREFAAQLRTQLEGMQATPWGKRGDHSDGLDPTQISQIQVFLITPKQPYRFSVDQIRATGTFDPASQVIPEPFFPFVDRFGQYLHADWPGKVTTDRDLRDAADREASEVRASPRPPSWNKYGGWADGPQLEATGHFRSEKVQGVWHLIDPEGRLFFSLGVDAVRSNSATIIDQGRAPWFADAPWESDDPAMTNFLGEAQPRRSDYAKRTVKTFDFYQANLFRKYGEDWEAQWLDRTPARLMNWGFNTIANWSDPQLFEDTTIPYTHWVFINSAKLPWQKGDRNRISDPWHPMFKDELRRRIENMTKGTADDPWCIGYFLDNELSWGEEDHLARGLLKAKPDQNAKQELFKFLQTRYSDIADLNSAWQVDYASWDQAQQGESDPQTDAAREDLVAFNEQIVRTYYSTVSGMFKEMTPDKLYLGSRLAEYNAQVARVAAEYCDVVSFNVYRDTLAGWTPIPEFDRPIIIGEFHFGTNDRGAFNKGLVPASSTQDKADRFKTYVQSAVANPLVVGTHWFQLNDQPTTGRPLDGENHGIGFLSITDTPHAAMIEASRELAGQLYLGSTTPREPN